MLRIDDPTDIAGCKLWLAADAITGLSDGDPVSSWTDNSGLSNNLSQATGGKQPTYQTNEINGKPIVRFDGSNDILVGDLGASLTSPTVFLVIKSNDSNIILSQNIFGANGGWRISRGSNTTASFTLGQVDDYSLSGIDWTVSQWRAISFNVTGNNGTATIRTADSSNNGQRATVSIGTQVASASRFTIGGFEGHVNLYSSCDIAEAIVYDSPLTADQMQAVEDYLWLKYQIGTVSKLAKIQKAVWEAAARTEQTTTDLSGLRHLLRSTSLSALSNGATVTQWQDESGLGFHMENTDPARRPIYRTNIVNGYPAVDFDGSDDILTSSLYGCPLTSNTGTLFLVAIQESSSTERAPYYMGTGNTNGWGIATQTSSGNRIGRLRGGVAWDNTSVFSRYMWTVYSMTQTTGDCKIYYDNILAGTLTTNPNTPTTQGAVGGHIGLRSMPGYITEAMTFNSVLSSSELARIQRSLSAKYKAGAAARQQDIYAAAVWTYSTRTESGGGGTTTVGNDVQFLWNVLQTVAKQNQVLWNVQAHVTTNKSYLWNTRALAGKGNQYLWNVYSLVAGNTLDLLWNTFANVNKTNNYLWNINQIVNKQTSYLWNNNGLVNTDYDILWNVKALANKQNSFLWNVNNTVGTTDSFLWNNYVNVNKEVEFLWNVMVLAGVSKQVSFLWNVLQTVSKNNNYLWNVNALVNKEVDLLYNVRQLTGKNTNLLWNQLQTVGDGYSLLWNVRANVLSQKNLLWNTLATTNTTKNFLWNNLKLVSKDLTQLWNVYNKVGKDTDFLWNVLVPANRSIQLLWNIIAGKAQFYDFDLYITLQKELELYMALNKEIDLYITRTKEF